MIRDEDIERYSNLVLHMARKMARSVERYGVTQDDLYAAGLIGVWKALETYKPPVPEEAWVKCKIHFEMLSEVRALARLPKSVWEGQRKWIQQLKDGADPETAPWQVGIVILSLQIDDYTEHDPAGDDPNLSGVEACDYLQRLLQMVEGIGADLMPFQGIALTPFELLQARYVAGLNRSEIAEMFGIEPWIVDALLAALVDRIRAMGDDL